MPAPPEILQLVQRFELHREDYTSANYNETQVRREFLDPFFKALGWDIDNIEGYAEAYKDVVHEDALKVGANTTAPDYSFRIGGVRKFFVEAKKPSVNLREGLSPAYQLRRYAWSAKLPLSILTDFEEFVVYDCRIRPGKNDKASTARILYVRYDEYVERWDEIAAIFSRNAILKGSFDKYAESNRRKRGTAEVDAEFLKEIESWRDQFARNLALRNPNLSQRELNFAVQKTIDRIIFLRICEDRGIETYKRLASVTNGPGVYKRLCELFRQADDRYNSGLFHFHKEKERHEPPDEFTLSLAIDDKLLRDVIGGLYYPESPYEFSVLGADILGQVYEQFLGKVIRLTKGHKAVVEDKPEVKKAGGVYYTPTYIVDYIVEQTVGKLLEGKTPKQAAKLRILDPACGSGSFLIGAYQHLLDWHRDWYVENAPAKHPKQVYQGSGGLWRLTTAERKRILLNNIYGVDIDTQAVEVTKLSLLLKVLEGESRETLQRQLFARQRALPDLGDNIKCGNSLIGPDFYDTRQLDLFDEDDHLRINAFDWNAEFPTIMKSGGFDAVIGNPPYVRIQNLSEYSPEQAAYVKDTYESAATGNFDLYVAFVERGFSRLGKTGRLGFILPSKFLSTDYGISLRRLLSQSKSVEQIVDFGHEQVFANATTYTCLMFLNRRPVANIEYVRTKPQELHNAAVRIRSVPRENVGESAWLFADAETQQLLGKLRTNATELLNIPAAMSRGSSTGADDVFCLVDDDGLRTRDGKTVNIEPELLRRPTFATDFNRYRFRQTHREWIIFPYSVSPDGYCVIPEDTLRKKFPNGYRYLVSHRDRLETRKQWRDWYGYSAPRNLHIHDCADRLVPLLADRGLFALNPRDSRRYCLMASGGFSISIKPPEVDPLYVLGLVNSRLLFWNLRQISNKFRGGWITCTKQYFGTLPIRLNKGTTSGTSTSAITSCVRRILELYERAKVAKTSHERTALERQIESTDRQIDRLVYEIYELTPTEIALVEEATPSPR